MNGITGTHSKRFCSFSAGNLKTGMCPVGHQVCTTSTSTWPTDGSSVEVTRFTDSPRVQQLAEIDKRTPWLLPDMEHGWHLSIDEDAPIGRLRREVNSQLRILEGRASSGFA